MKSVAWDVREPRAWTKTDQAFSDFVDQIAVDGEIRDFRERCLPGWQRVWRELFFSPWEE